MPHSLNRILAAIGRLVAPGGSDGSRRNRSIRLAVMTSLLSKGGTALLQLVSIPIAIRVLGFESFGIYSTVALAVIMVALFQIGVGPALTHGISRALTAGDRPAEKEVYSTSFFLMLGMALLGGSLAFLVFSWVPVSVLFGEQYADHAAEMRSALRLGTAIILAQFVLTHTERARDGYLEATLNNAWGAAGNLIGALSVGIGIFFFPTIEFLLLAVYGSNVVGKIGNTIHLLARRPHLVPSLRHFRKSLVRPLAGDGIAFAFSSSVIPLVEFNASALMLAHLFGPAAVGAFNILIQIYTIFTGFILMFTMPTWPAVVDAFARDDLAWIRSVARKLRTLSLAYAACAGLGLVLFGPLLIPLWLGEEVSIPRLVLLAFSLFFVAGVRNHVNHSLLLGIGKVRESASYIAFESAAALALAATGIAFFGLPGLLFGIFLAKVLVTGIAFPRLFEAGLRAHRSLLPGRPFPREEAAAAV